MRYADVILPLPLDGLFTYSVPCEFDGRIRLGVRVRVPLGKSKTYTALVARVHDEAPSFTVKPISDVLDDSPVLLPGQYRLWQWISDYYMSPLGDIYKAALPAGMKAVEGYRPKTEQFVGLCAPYRDEHALRDLLAQMSRAPKQQQMLQTFLEQRGEITRDFLLNASHCKSAALKALTDRQVLYLYEREVGRLNNGGEPHPERIKALNAAQEDAYNSILLQFMRHKVVLLHGVTSSGKTEIYIHLIQKTIDEGRQVLYLLPEIALTVQMMDRLQRVFGNRLGIYHSKYSDAERVEIWKKQLTDHPYDVILGARSACLLPFQNLGLVIVDEEHETSFKQQDPSPRYHARSVAVMMSELLRPENMSGNRCAEATEPPRVLLGTATPSVESYYNAQNGKYGLVELNQRFQGIALPEVQVVDIKDLARRKLMSGPFSPQLLSAVRTALQNGQQAILFQNRRGFAPMIECRTCGWVPHCEHCDVALTYHKTMDVLTCHYCGATYPVPSVCPACGGKDLRGRGYGTEKIEDSLAMLFPDARIGRMDLDTTRSRHAYDHIISDFSQGKTNLLVGTQMVSKGLDFDRVSVVGILDADSMLNYPDFRAYELAFMMMAQVSGRAGRRGSQGLVILQTKHPDLPVISQVVRHDYVGFYRNLLEERQTFSYPPFFRLVYIYLKHSHERVVATAAEEMGAQLRQLLPGRVLGPDKPAVARVKTLSIRKIVLKLELGINHRRVRELLALIRAKMEADSRYGALKILFDVDPL